jgi:hypothetical protein
MKVTGMNTSMRMLLIRIAQANYMTAKHYLSAINTLCEMLLNEAQIILIHNLRYSSY